MLISNALVALTRAFPAALRSSPSRTKMSQLKLRSHGMDIRSGMADYPEGRGGSEGRGRIFENRPSRGVDRHRPTTIQGDGPDQVPQSVGWCAACRTPDPPSVPATPRVLSSPVPEHDRGPRIRR